MTNDKLRGMVDKIMIEEYGRTFAPQYKTIAEGLLIAEYSENDFYLVDYLAITESINITEVKFHVRVDVIEFYVEDWIQD